MILSRIYNKFGEEEDFLFVLGSALVSGLFSGLVSSLSFGLLWGLVSGLLFGLVWSLSCGLLWGLVFSLFGGLLFGLVFGSMVILTNFSEALPFINGLIPVLLLVGIILIFTELFYWLSPKEKIKKKDLFFHTCMMKAEAFIETILGLSFITMIYIFIREFDFVKYFPEIIKWIGYVGVAIICILFGLLISYGWIKLNSLKYKK